MKDASTGEGVIKTQGDKNNIISDKSNNIDVGDSINNYNPSKELSAHLNKNSKRFEVASNKILDKIFEINSKKSEERSKDLESKKIPEDFIKRIEIYREKKEKYDSEKIRLEKLIEELRAELEKSEEQDRIDNQKENEKSGNDNEVDNKNTELPIEGSTIKGNGNHVEDETSQQTDDKTNPDKKTNKDNVFVEDNNIVVDSNIDSLINDMPEEDLKLIQKEVKNSIVLPFESPRVKKDTKTFLKNQIVKLASGFKIPKKIKGIIERSAKKLLITTAVVSVWSSGDSFIKPSSVKAEIKPLNKKEIFSYNKQEILPSCDAETYNKLPDDAKKIYLYATRNIKDEGYMIVDKPTATLYVINKDKKLITQIPVLLGQTKGEEENIADPDSDIAGNRATTPAGKYRLERHGLGITEEDYTLYKGDILSIVGSGGLAIHRTYPNELTKRTMALNSPTSEDNRVSWGCINVDENNWKYIGNNFNNGGTIFILPDYPDRAVLDPETGKVEKINDDKNTLEVEDNLLAMNNTK